MSSLLPFFLVSSNFLAEFSSWMLSSFDFILAMTSAEISNTTSFSIGDVSKKEMHHKTGITGAII